MAINLWPFNAVKMEGPVLKTPAFYVTSFVETPGRTGQLIRLDYLHNRAKVWSMPAGIGPWGIIKSQDVNLYMEIYGGGVKLLCFDSRTEKGDPIPQTTESFRKEEFVITDLV